jgi:hypothetical protein
MQNGCQIHCDSCDGNTRGPVPKFIFADGEPPEDWDVWGVPGLVPDPRYPQPNHFGNSTPVSPGGSGQTICPSRKPKATICEPALRTININAPCGSSSDYYYYSPWRAPGSAPVLDPWCVACRVESQPAMQSTASRESAYLRAVSLSLPLCVPVSLCVCRALGRHSGAAGGRRPGQGNGGAGAAYANTSRARLADLGSTLPARPSGTVWRAGSVAEVAFTTSAFHGGGYSYR